MSGIRTSSRPWVIGLGLVAAGLVAFLLIADHPGEIAEETAKRVASGKKPTAESDFATGLWWAALGNLVIMAALLSGVRLWARRLPGPNEGRGLPWDRISRGFCLALLGIMALGGAMRWNLAHRSLWWDELWPIKYGVVGYHLGEARMPLEERRFADGSWERSLWHYTRPMNHPAASFPARLSHVVWRSIVRPAEPREFSDFAVRFPNWLASMAAIGAVGLAGGRWGRPVGGLFGALILALHPWHIRYGIDLRGYCWVILWSAAGLLWLTLMFRRDRSRWWAWWGFGINQALLVWSFPHAAAVAAGLFAAAAVLIARNWRGSEDRWTAILRLVLVNVVAAAIYFQLFFPNLLQTMRWFESTSEIHAGHSLNGGYLRELFSFLTTGLPWKWTAGEEAVGLVDLASRFGSSRAGWGLMLGVGGVVILGMVNLWRRHREAAIITSSILIGGLVLIGWFAVVDTYFYSRFLSFLVVPFAIGIGMACDWGGGNSRYRILLAAVVLAVFSGVAAPQWRVLMKRPYSPMRDVAEGLSDVAGGPAIFACYGHGAEMLPIYEPRVRSASSLADLQELVAEAETRGTGLVVTYGYASLNRTLIPDGFEWLDDPARFVEVRAYPGIEPDFFFRTLRWTGREPAE